MHGERGEAEVEVEVVREVVVERESLEDEPVAERLGELALELTGAEAPSVEAGELFLGCRGTLSRLRCASSGSRGRSARKRPRSRRGARETGAVLAGSTLRNQTELFCCAKSHR